MTHGDFDYEYLLAVVLGEDGRPRFDRVSFAGHFDSLMRGRRGAVRPRSEAELNPFRESFAQMFLDLRREHGVRSYVAHNMTVTPSNLDEVAQVTRDVTRMPFDMLSFQPAAFIGDDRRWNEDFSEVSIDAVWSRVEEGVGQRLPWQAAQFGDPRCNRSMVALKVGGIYAPLLDPEVRKDLAARDRFLDHFGGMIFGDTPKPLLALKITRALLRHPDDVPPLVGLAARIVRRGGGLRALVGAARRRTGGVPHLRGAQLHGCRAGRAGVGADAGGHGQRRPGAPRDAGAIGGVHVRDEPPRDRGARAGVRAALGARPGRELGPPPTAAVDALGAPSGRADARPPRRDDPVIRGRRIVSVLALIVGAAFGLAACSSAPAPSTTESARPWSAIEKAARGETVNLWMYGGDQQGNAYVDRRPHPGGEASGGDVEARTDHRHEGRVEPDHLRASGRNDGTAPSTWCGSTATTSAPGSRPASGGAVGPRSCRTCATPTRRICC